jgi:hypothetical protein
MFKFITVPQLRLNVRAVSLAEGVRAGLAVAVTVLAGAVLGLPHFGLAALGALLTCFADPGGPVLRRTPVLPTASLAGCVPMASILPPLSPVSLSSALVMPAFTGRADCRSAICSAW